MSYTCDRCQQETAGARVVFTTEATDPAGVDVTVEKHWVTCPSCADDVFARLSMPSPWDDDGRSVAFPEDDGLLAAPAGGFAGLLGR